MTIFGLHLARQAWAGSAQLGVESKFSTGDVVRLRAAEAAASASNAVVATSFGDGSVALRKLGSPLVPFDIRYHETVVDCLEKSSLELAEIFGRKTRDLGPSSVRVGAVLDKLGSDHDGSEEHASGAASEAELFLIHAVQRRARLSFDFDLNAGGASGLSERHLSRSLAGFTETNAIE